MMYFKDIDIRLSQVNNYTQTSLTILEVTARKKAFRTSLADLEHGGLGLPALDGLLAPFHEVVHVLQELLPRHDARRGVRRDEVRALGALGVGADLLAHLLADGRELVLKLHTVLEILSGARAGVNADSMIGLLEDGGLRLPALDRLLAPLDQVVHVLEKFLPSHDPGRGVRGDEVWALCAFRVGADLFAHVLADARQLVLDLGAMLQVLRGACLFPMLVGEARFGNLK